MEEKNSIQLTDQKAEESKLYPAAALIGFIVLPYIVGFAFLYLYIFSARPELFSYLLTKDLLVVTWIVGYECISITFILYLIAKYLTQGEGSIKP